jgi:hypothetical protein
MHLVRKTTPEDGHTVMTETYRVLIMFLQNIFNNFSVLKCGCESVFKKKCISWFLNKVNVTTCTVQK